MAKEHLTADLVRSLLDYDKDTGLFQWKPGLRRNGTTTTGPIRKCDPEGYIRFTVRKSLCYAHRLAWLYVTGAWPAGQIDHINGDRADNRFVNLRDVDAAVNAQNRRKAYAGALSGMLGVHLNRKTGRWVARITARGERRTIGTFATPELAHEAYKATKRKLHEGGTI